MDKADRITRPGNEARNRGRGGGDEQAGERGGRVNVGVTLWVWRWLHRLCGGHYTGGVGGIVVGVVTWYVAVLGSVALRKSPLQRRCGHHMVHVVTTLPM